MLEDEERLSHRGWSDSAVGSRIGSPGRGHLGRGAYISAAERFRNEGASRDQREDVHTGDGAVVKLQAQRGAPARAARHDVLVPGQVDRVDDDAPTQGAEPDAANRELIHAVRFLRNHSRGFAVQQAIDDPRGAPPHRPEHEQYNNREGEEYPTEAHLLAEASLRGERLRSPLINFHHLELLAPRPMAGQRTLDPRI